MGATKRGVITTNTTTTIKAIQAAPTSDAWENDYGNHNCLVLTNTHTSTDVSVIVFFEDAGANTYIVAKTSIPATTTLIIEKGLDFDNSIYSLKITTTGTGKPLHYTLE